MKLLKLRFSNLNSLYGEWTIDFEHQAYISNGLFAITGPTGAGKSTLLDAIALALYGRTPRLGTISASINEIMSRDRGNCFAEATFQSSKGTFRAFWSQHRARSKGDGSLQQPKHELTDVLTGRVLTTKKSELQAVIQDCVGLDYEQFTRSIMLAQGDFALFLKSEDNKRAAILAKITGTDIYARIGMAVYQRHRLESDSIRLLSAQTSTIELLNGETVIEFESQILDIVKSIDELNQYRVETEGAIHWFARLHQLENEIQLHALVHKKKALASEQAQPMRLLLERSQRASAFRRTLECIRDIQEKKSECESQVAQMKRKHADLAKRKEAVRSEVETANRTIGALTSSIESSRPHWLETHDLDIEIRNRQVTQDRLNEQNEAIVSKSLTYQCEKVKLEGERIQIKTLHDALHAYLLANKHDSELLAQLPIIERLYNEYELRLRNDCELVASFAFNNKEVEKAIVSEADAKVVCEVALEAVNEKRAAIIEREAFRTEILQGLSPAALQDELDNLTKRRSAELEYLNRLDRILAQEQEHSTKQAELQSLRANALEQHNELVELAKHIDQQTQLVTAIEAMVLKDQLIASLQEHRARLAPGQPCALCGSTEHPWFQKSEVLPKGKSELSLDQAKAKLSEYTRHQEEISRSYDRLEQRAVQLEQSLISMNQMLQSENDEIIEVGVRLELKTTVSVEGMAIVRRTIESLQAQEDCIVSRIKASNATLETIAQFRTELEKLTDRLAKAEQTIQAALNYRLGVEDSRRRVYESLDGSRDVLKTTREELVAKLETFHVEWSDEFTTTVEMLNARCRLWKTSEQDASQYEKRLLQIEGGLVSLAVQMEDLDHGLQEGQLILKTASEDLESLKLRRRQLFGDKDPKLAEHELTEKLRGEKIELDRLVIHYNTNHDDWQQLDRQVIQLESSIESYARQVNQQKDGIERDLGKSGFVDIQELEAAVQTEVVMDDWMNQLSSLDELLRSSTAIVTQKELERIEWISKKPRDQSLETLRLQFDEIEGKTEALRVKRAELQQKLLNNQTRVKERNEAEQELLERQADVQNWSVLNELIGSSDGAKFRKFAQGITFELLLEYANIQLKKLSDRYLLRKSDEGLGLVVIDHYQSSRPRSATNLSGGESFLVSLALALGLSKLASQNVQIDSLFLDEGFGTLDEETLEEALYALSNLRQEGKLVGLISHVQALNQQIPVQIEVLKGEMGRSRLRGPGIT